MNVIQSVLLPSPPLLAAGRPELGSVLWLPQVFSQPAPVDLVPKCVSGKLHTHYLAQQLYLEFYP